jgi:GNAT superfamily N-acetyltransferase
MFLPTTVPIPPPDPRTVPLTLSDVPAMIALTDVAFPGFFRPRTCEMGHYYGMPAETSKEELIAIAGERFTFPGYSEISCVCTHPSHRGQGLATSLIWEVARRHRREGIVSWLHVAARNQNALNLYRKLGFQIVRTIPLHQISRSE